MPFKVIIGNAPDAWAEKVWQRSKRPPFQQYKKSSKRAANWISVYRLKSTVRVDDLESDEVEAVAEKAWKWIEKQLNDDNFKKTVKVVAELIEELPEPAA